MVEVGEEILCPFQKEVVVTQCSFKPRLPRYLSFLKLADDLNGSISALIVINGEVEAIGLIVSI